jgi:hypothetical protein
VKRRAFLGAALAAAAWDARGAVARTQDDDFDVLWRAIDEGYAYFDGATRARWRRSRERFRAQAMRIAPAQFGALLEAAIAQLRDDHVTLVPAGDRTARRIPYELDIWPRWRAGAVEIESVRTFSDADVAGLHAGELITHIEGVPVAAALRERLGDGASHGPDVEWALRRMLAGPRTGTQRLQVREGEKPAIVDIERTPPAPSTTPPMLARRMGDERDIGYVRVRVGAAAHGLASQFDGAMSHMTGTRALIVDLRDVAGPGARETTLAILSRFAREPSAWQVRTAGQRRETDMVRPADAAYVAPLAVLVDRWTAGEAEALAAGLESVCRARIVGTPMAGLRGELQEVALPMSRMAVRFPGERTYSATSGVPRESMRPSLPVDLAAPSGGPGDPILYQALKLFERR